MLALIHVINVDGANDQDIGASILPHHTPPVVQCSLKPPLQTKGRQFDPRTDATAYGSVYN